MQLYYGHLKSVESLTASNTEDMTVTESRENGMYLYSCKINCSLAGRYGFTVQDYSHEGMTGLNLHRDLLHGRKKVRNEEVRNENVFFIPNS